MQPSDSGDAPNHPCSIEGPFATYVLGVRYDPIMVESLFDGGVYE